MTAKELAYFIIDEKMRKSKIEREAVKIQGIENLRLRYSVEK
jgi:hypothetical protein